MSTRLEKLGLPKDTEITDIVFYILEQQPTYLK